MICTKSSTYAREDTPTTSEAGTQLEGGGLRSDTKGVPCLAATRLRRLVVGLNNAFIRINA